MNNLLFYFTKIFFLVLFIATFIASISFYNNIFKSVINLKLKIVKRKYKIINEADYLVTCGINLFFFSMICLFTLIIMIVDPNNSQRCMIFSTILFAILSTPINKSEKKYLIEKS